MQKKTLLSIVVCFTMTTLYAQKTEPADTLKGQTLDEVVVAQRRKLIKNDIDKLTYDVQHDKTAQTKTTLEILKKIPLVTVDGQENIRVQGSTSFKVYRNGHPDPSLSGQNLKDILKAIPASTIKRIEVITDPGAKYDAEGTTAILNIVMMSSSKLQGVSGNVNSKIDSYGSVRLGTYLTTKVGKLTTTVNYNYANQNKKQTENYREEAYNYVKTGEQKREYGANSTAATIHFGNISASYEIDSLNLMTASINFFGYKADANTQNTNERWDKNNQLIYKFNNDMTTPDYSDVNLGGRFDYQHKTHLDGEVLTLSYMLAATRPQTTFRQTYSNMVNFPVSYTSYDQNTRERFTEHTFQIDYVRPFGKHHKIESGTKYILRNNNSTSLMDYQGTTPDMESKFKHKAQVAAAYLSYILTAGKWAARAGLRYEFTRMKASYPDGSNADYHANLNDWVPSASLQYKISDGQTLKFSYNTSINRPGIGYLNPAIISTPTAVSFGNANLGSSRNQKLQLEYMLVTSKLTLQLSPYYSFTNNGIGRILYEQNRKDVSTFQNILKSKIFGISSYTAWTPFTGTSFTLNASMRYARITLPTPYIKNSGCGGGIYFDWEQKIPWKLTLTTSLGGEYGNRVYNPYAIEGHWFYYNFTLTRRFLKDKLTVSLSAESPFVKERSTTYRIVQGDYTGYERAVMKPQCFKIGLSWKFGKLRASVKTAARSIENDDLVGSKKK
ncbi:outer membrane beta-barrel family protein [Prevotella histicola]|uniref:outer membrane beta-barrel family protein n=3 Tax=Prevotella histicola TaxID=470565 RepID=UPI001C5F78FA|nr:outer membrane beta-barrel family protein [Prevotella histicola]MBW4711535.1 TonB-dependent receptor [Prevotella histicola]MBW4876160.1 TonB-dependent receptor [Prevotella histicola]